MAVMTTVLTEFQDKGNERTYVAPGHTVALPRLVLQRRKIAAGTPESVAEDQISVLYGTVDSTSVPIRSRDLLTVTVRRPFDGRSADLTSALALFREIVASDEFTTVVETQGWVKP